MGKMQGEVELPKGLLYFPNFITAEEETDLLRFIVAIEFKGFCMHGKLARRSVKSFGYSYDFDKRIAEPSCPVPPELEFLRIKIARQAGIHEAKLIQCLVSRYPPGATIGWHCDVMAFGPQVFGVSLLSSCFLRFQKTQVSKRKVYEMESHPRSLYILSGEARYKWQHSIPSVKQERYFITWRTLKS